MEPHQGIEPAAAASPDPELQAQFAPAAETADALQGFDAEVGEHDARLVALGLVVWVGSEPTFTDRHAQSPEWLSMALGGDKEVVAGRLIAGLCRSWPGRRGPTQRGSALSGRSAAALEHRPLPAT